MKSIWNDSDRQQLVTRLTALGASNQRRWGKMSLEQMFRHLDNSLRMVAGDLKVSPKSSPLSWWPLNKLVIYALPWPQGAPTAPELIVSDTAALEEERSGMLASLERVTALAGAASWPRHPAFGSMSEKDWGALVHRHIDHHLKQFGG